MYSVYAAIEALT